jgi:hypothetical protein
VQRHHHDGWPTASMLPVSLQQPHQIEAPGIGRVAACQLCTGQKKEN